jgi:acetyl esterase
MQLDPQVQVIVDELNAAMAEGDAPSLWDRPVADVRADFDDLVLGLQGDVPAVGRVENREIPGPHGPIPIRIYWPQGSDAATPLPVYINYHGSGYVLLSIDTHDNVCRALCQGAGCIVIGVSYRKAPEHKFPVATDESWASLEWTATNAAKIGADAARIAVGGDSAGGGLAAVTAQRAKREGGPALVFQLLVYPVTDTRQDRPSYKTFGDGYLLTAETMAWFFDCYFADDADKADLAAAPLRADDLSGLPPALVMTASHDPLYDDGVAYAEKLKAAGVATDYRNYQGHIHGFWTATGRMDIAAEAHATACAALRQAFGTA